MSLLLVIIIIIIIINNNNNNNNILPVFVKISIHCSMIMELSISRDFKA